MDVTLPVFKDDGFGNPETFLDPNQHDIQIHVGDPTDFVGVFNNIDPVQPLPEDNFILVPRTGKFAKGETHVVRFRAKRR